MLCTGVIQMVKCLTNSFDLRWNFDALSAYRTAVETFCRNVPNSGLKPSSVLSNKNSPKPLKLDKMKISNKIVENDENSHGKLVPTSNPSEKKKNTLQR